MKRFCVILILLILSSLACGRSQSIVTQPAPQATATAENIAPAGSAVETSPAVETATAPVFESTSPAAVGQPTSPAVPAEYQGMVDQIEAALQSVKADYPAQGGRAPVFAAELSYANGNIGESLLKPETLALVRVQLNGLAKMGVGGVVLAIKFPLVEPGFPRSAEYLRFFQQVGAEVHQRHMKLLVESGALFSGTAFSPLKVDWTQYPTAMAFRDAEIHQLQTIAKEVQPDYLQIANEPTTTAMLTQFKDTPEDYAAFVSRAVKAIPHQPGVLLGAGAGTWENQSYVTTLYPISGLDFIDLHVYPVGNNGGLLRLAAELAQKGRAAGKRVVISEAWLYKTDASTAYQANDFTSVIGRDVFSFWEPLDTLFIQDLTGLARASGIEYVSFFWVREFYAYLDYEQYRSTPLDQMNPFITRVSVAASKDGALSPLGLFFQDWIHQQTK